MEEDASILATFKKHRPPGCGITSREVHNHLPRNIQNRITRRTVINRLAAVGYTPRKKIQKNDVSKLLAKRRMKFAAKYKGWTKAKRAYPRVRVNIRVRVRVRVLSVST